MNRAFRVFCLAVAAWGAMALPLPAANYSWVGGAPSYERDFLTPSNWSPEWYFGADSYLRIDAAGATTSPVLASFVGPINELYLGSLTSTEDAGFDPATTAGGKLTILENGYLIAIGKIDVGVSGIGAWESTLALGGGTLIPDGVTYGTSTGGTIVQEAGAFRVGVLNNTGTLEMSGGSRIEHQSAEFTIGALSNGYGYANLHDYAIIALTNTNLNVATAASGAPVVGRLNMYDNAIIGGNASTTLNVGHGAGADGIVAMAGSSTVAGQRPWIDRLDAAYVGKNGGSGEVDITDAACNFTSHFVVGMGEGASGTLTMTTSPDSVNPATLDVGGNFHVGYDSGGGECNVNGDSSITVHGWVVVGHSDIPGSVGASGTVNMNSGTLTKNNVPGTYLLLGTAGTGVGGTAEWNQNGGTTVIRAPVIFSDDNSGEGILNLNGGVFAATRLYNGYSGTGIAKGRVNFNGGTLQVVATDGFQFAGGSNFISLRDAPDFVVTVKQLGATIDTNGGDIIIPVGLMKDPLSAGGGLTKIGAGTLSLNGQSTYTGPTVIKDGTLQTKITFQGVYTAPNYPGNRTGTAYSLGHDFTVNTSVKVTQLGIFDDLGDGIIGSHAVHLTDLDNPTFDQIVTLDSTTTGTTYTRGFRFVNLTTPLTLGAGHYQVWVDTMGGDGDDSFAQDISEYESGNTGALVMGTSWYSETPGIMPNLLWGGNDAAVSFVFYDPSSVVNAKVLAATTPVELGGATGSLPTLALEGSNQTIASLADVAGAAVTGVVTNSLPIQPAILTIDAASGTTTYTGSITGNLSLVKSGDGTQNLLGSLTYTGDTTVTGGVLNVSSIDNPTATVTVTAGTLTATSLNVDTLIIGETGLAVVPEPSTFVLLFLAGIGMLATVCRRK